MSKKILSSLAAATVLALAAPAMAQNLAIVNGKAVPKARADALAQQLEKSGRAVTPEMQGQIKDEIIAREIFVQEAQKQGLDATPEFKTQMEIARESLLIRDLFTAWQAKNTPTDAELKAEYDTQVAAMPKEYKARHILVETKETAESIIRELQAVTDPAKLVESFGKLAEKESKDSSGKSGGDLGWFSPQTMVKPFADAVATLEKGKYTTEPVQSEFGFHVILLEDTRSPEVPEFEQVKPQVEMFAQRKKLQAFIDGLRETAKIQK